MDDRHPSVASECTETVHGRILEYSGWLFRQTQWGDSGTVVEKSFSNQKVASSNPCRSVLEQDTELLMCSVPSV